MKIKEMCSKVLKNKIGRMICLILAAVMVVSVILICLYDKTETLDTTYIIEKLEKASELTTAKFTYTGISEFKDSGVDFINKSDFVMVYQATARAGIDVSKIDVKSNDKKRTVTITIPKAKVLDVKVDTNTIKYFDEKFSLFNINKKEDSNKAIALAEDEAIKEAESIGILDMADNQAETLIKGLIEDAVPDDYEIKVINAN